MTHTPTPLKGSIMMIAGEASGDLHGARVVEALKQIAPQVDVFGIGGRRMKAAGAHIMIEAESLAVVGITEALANASRLLHALRSARQWIRSRKPDLLLLIDFPDFNLKTAAFAKKAAVPILYYISPQVWAWRSGRVRKIKKIVDKIAVILPFEEDFFKRHGVPATFVGHPLLDNQSIPAQACVPDPAQPTIGLLPGSRQAEVIRLLPPMLEAAAIVTQSLPAVRFLLSQAPSVNAYETNALVNSFRQQINIEVVNGPVKQVFQSSQLAVAASGTVTLEAAIHQAPLIIVYKVSPLSYMLGRLMINVNHIGLVNLIAGRPVVPELIQKQVNGPNLASHILDFFNNPQRLEKARQDLSSVHKALGKPGAAKRVARMALDLMEKHHAA